MSKKKNTMAYQVKVHLFMVRHAARLLALKMQAETDEKRRMDYAERASFYMHEQCLLEEIMNNCGHNKDIDDIVFKANAAADYQFETGSNSKYIENIDLI